MWSALITIAPAEITESVYAGRVWLAPVKASARAVLRSEMCTPLAKVVPAVSVGSVKE